MINRIVNETSILSFKYFQNAIFSLYHIYTCFLRTTNEIQISKLNKSICSSPRIPAYWFNRAGIRSVVLRNVFLCILQCWWLKN